MTTRHLGVATVLLVTVSFFINGCSRHTFLTPPLEQTHSKVVRRPLTTPTSPPAHIMTWAYVLDGYTAASNANKWLTYCEGNQADTVTDCSWKPSAPTGAKPIMYWSANIAQPDVNGKDFDMPFTTGDLNYGGGTCPEPSGNLWAATTFPTANKPSETWFLHANTLSTWPPTAQYRIGALEGGSNYMWAVNVLDSTLQAYANGVAQNCYTINNHVSIVWSRYYGIFEDNATYFMQAGEWPFGGDNGNIAYTSGKNIGVSTGSPPYAYAGCAGNGLGPTFYNGTRCTTSSKLSAGDLYPYEWDESNYDDSWWNFTAAITRNANDQQQGAHFNWFMNGQLSNWDQFWTPQTTGTITEEQVLQNGVIQPARNIANVIDICSNIAANYSQFQWILLDYAPGAGGGVLGSALHQQQQRVHFAVVWLCMYPNLVDWPDLEYDVNDYTPYVTESKNAQVWDFDFYYPTGPFETAAASTPSGCGLYGTIDGYGNPIPCTAGGAHETLSSGGYCAVGTAPNCVYVREFSDCWWQKPDFSQGQIDEHQCGVALNLTGRSQTIVSSWFPKTWSFLKHVLVPCTPSGYFSGDTYAAEGQSTTVCTSSTGNDAGAGGSLDWSTPVSSITSLPANDAVFFTSQ